MKSEKVSEKQALHQIRSSRRKIFTMDIYLLECILQSTAMMHTLACNYKTQEISTQG